jgi:hypothetical protein
VCVCSTGVWTQGFIHARQALYLLSLTSSSHVHFLNGWASFYVLICLYIWCVCSSLLLIKKDEVFLLLLIIK